MRHSKFIAIFFLSGVMLSFQQCSKVDFSSVEAASQSKLNTDIAKGDGGVDSNDDGIPDNTGNPDDTGTDYEQVPEEEADKLRGQCDIARLLPRQSLTDGAVISNVRGSLIASFEGTISIDNVRGNLILFGVTEQSVIDVARNIRGNFIVCAGSINQMIDVRGNTLVVHGDIGSVDDHRGNLIVFDGHIGSITNFRGNVRTLDGRMSRP